MSVATLLWIIAVSGLTLGIAGAAAAALRHLHRPERWVWLVALAVTAVLPFLPAPATSPATTGPGVAFVSPVTQVMSAASASLPAPTHRSIPWVPLLWTMASAGTVLITLGSAWTLSRRRERWPRRRVDGDMLRVSRDFGPAVVGWIDPEIVLPAWAIDMDARHRRLILRHENEHRWAHDPQLLALGVLLLAAAPWNPIAWLQFRGLRRAIEFDCDARVLNSGASPRAYGRLLLSVQLDEGGYALFAPALREPASFLERRLQTMSLRNRPTARLRVLGLTLIAAALTAVACEAPRPTEAPPAATEVPMGVVAENSYVEVSPATVVEAIEVLPDRVAILIDEAGRIRVTAPDREHPRYITPDQVETVARNLLRQYPGQQIFVGIEPQARAGVVMDVQEGLERAGVAKVGFIRLRGEPSAGERTDGPVPALVEESRKRLIEAIEVQGRFEEQEVLCADGSPKVVEGGTNGLRILGCEREKLPSIELWEPEGAVLEQLGAGATAASMLGARAEGTPLIYIDGVRTSDAAREETLGEIRPSDIERIEVIKGETAERLYGADASDGIIQIFTKKN